MGNVLSAGIGQAPARQAAIYAGIPNTVPATTVSKVCGSGMQAVIFGAKTIAVGDADLVVAGGMESMSNVPYYLDKARTRVPHGRRQDRRRDDLRRPLGSVLERPHGQLRRQVRRRVQVHARAAGRVRQGELPPRPRRPEGGDVRRRDRGGARAPEEGRPAHREDRRGARQGRPEQVRAACARPSRKDGTITAANASSINDGASALVLASEKAVKEHKLEPLGAHRRLRRRGAGARVVHDGAGQGHRRHRRRSSACARTRSTSTRSTRPSRSWRWSCSKLCGLDLAEGQRPRRRGRPRAPHRRLRRAHPGDARCTR